MEHFRKMSLFVAISLLLIVSVISVRLMVPEICTRSQSDQLIAVRDELIKSRVRPILPVTGIVGYIGDSGDASFYQMQYGLAPLVLDRNKTDYDFLIVNCADPDQSLVCETRTWETVAEFASGPLAGVSIRKKTGMTTWK